MPRFILAFPVVLALAAGPANAQPMINVDGAPALAAWTTPEFAAFTRATGIMINLVPSQAGADILIAPAPFAQIAEHEKRTLPYIPRETAQVSASLKDDDGDWTAIALTALALAPSGAPPGRTAADALHLLLIHNGGATPPGSPALLMTLAANGQAAISFPVSPSGGRETIIIPYFIARLKSGQNPAAAAQLIDFLLAKPAQAALPAFAWALPARTDLAPASGHFEILEKCLAGIAIYTPDWHRARKSLAG
jgi:hypothetical protein